MPESNASNIRPDAITIRCNSCYGVFFGEKSQKNEIIDVTVLVCIFKIPINRKKVLTSIIARKNKLSRKSPKYQS